MAAALPFALLGTLFFPGIYVVLALTVYLLIAGPGWNPLEWHWLVQWVLVVSFVGGVVGWLPRMTMANRFDTNLYFRNYAPYAGMHHQESVGHFIDPPLSALTVHAGPLDEALLALSSEPLVYGNLLPLIEHRVFAEPRQLHGVLGTTETTVELTQLGLEAAKYRLRQFVHVATERPLRPIRRWVTRRVAEMLSNILSSSAFGLFPEEFDRARIHASTSAGVPDAIDEAVWDASRNLTEAPPTDTSVRAAREFSERYKFLWDGKDLEKKAEASVLWRQVSSKMQSISERYPDETIDRLSVTLMKTCVMLEEKQREIAGAVALKHSTYYTNEYVIRRVAKFLISGEVP